MVGTSLSVTRLSCRLVPRLKSTILHAATQGEGGETMTSDSAGHILLTPTQPEGSGHPIPILNPRPSHENTLVY